MQRRSLCYVLRLFSLCRENEEDDQLQTLWRIRPLRSMRSYLVLNHMCWEVDEVSGWSNDQTE